MSRGQQQAGAETAYRLAVGGHGPVARPTLDAAQQAVVDHESGPLLVLAGPGTGKTTTMVEAIVDRIERRGADPSSVLALTFSRKAAEQLRDRVTARLGRTTATAMCSTFHSFAYGLIRQHSPAGLYAAPLRLLSAPEQDVVLRELLLDTPEAVRWPEQLGRASQTRGFAREVAAVLGRAREKGLDPEGLAQLGAQHGLPELESAGWFLEQYLAVLDAQGATDYADLIRRAVIEAEAHRDELRRRFSHVFVDEYQDSDPGQVRLLQALAGDGGELVVVGDPHQSIYGFRGADVRGILTFPDQFRRADGAPAATVALSHVRRFGPRILAASSRIAARLPLQGSIGEPARSSFLAPQVGADRRGDRVDVVTYDTTRAEAERIADLLRRAHLEDGLPWRDMAVLVRSGRASIPGLRRALTAAGVPVEVARDEEPLVESPAVRRLLDALRAVVDLDTPDPSDRGALDPARAEALLLSPLVGLDATDVRALQRSLRRSETVRAHEEQRDVGSSPDLLLAAVVGDLAPGDDAVGRRVAAFAALLARARALLAGGASVEEVLWELWSGTSWPAALRAQVRRGGAAARRAHRDLDTVCALFDAAGRAVSQRDQTGVPDFLASLSAQEIPADTLAERGVRDDSLRLLTAHRAKGLEWRLVVVAHVQEEGWPDLRRRTSLLRADRIGAERYAEPVLQPDVTTRELLAEERRLFYVACTRARERLVVTAVASPDDEGEQPSRFLHELVGLRADERLPHEQGRPPRPMSLAGLVGELRQVAADESVSEPLRDAAARRLARLAREQRDGRPLVPLADPASWWGTRSTSLAVDALREPGEPVVLSASALAGLLDCPARWFWEREAGGSRPTSQAQGFGNIVHALADRVAKGGLSATADDLGALMAEVDAVWHRLGFRTPWSSSRERTEIEAALRRFLTWHHRPGARTVLATEQELRAEVSLPSGERVVLRGYADRLEVDDDGRVVVVDLKTGKYPPLDNTLAENPQLGLYQHAVDHGALDELLGEPGRSAGAELWQLRRETRGSLKVQVQGPQQPDDDGVLPVERQLEEATAILRAEVFPARPSGSCDRCAFVALCPAHVSGSVLS